MRSPRIVVKEVARKGLEANLPNNRSTVPSFGSLTVYNASLRVYDNIDYP